MNEIRFCLIDDEKESGEWYGRWKKSEPLLGLAHIKTPQCNLTRLSALQPDVLVFALNDKKDLQTLTAIKVILPSTEILILSQLRDEQSIVQAFTAGATGFVFKDYHGENLKKAILEIHQGGVPMDRKIARKLTSYFSSNYSFPLEPKLTSRESQILMLLAKGFMYKEIASILCLSIETVRTHVSNIYEKLEVNNRVEAINLVMGKPKFNTP
jgi:NarL family two-component system response regulator LiaR